MYNLLEYRDIYSKTSGSLWQYYKDEPALNNNDIIYFPVNSNDSNSFKVKQKITGKTNNNGIEVVEIMIPLNYLNSFWGTIEMPLMNCEISLMLTWSNNCF